MQSQARLLCTPQLAAHNRNWASPYVRQTCVIGGASDAPKVLGVRLGGAAACKGDMDQVCSKVAAARERIQDLNCPAAELTLQRV